MSSIVIAVGDSSVCKYVVVAHNQLLTFVSGNYDVCDNNVVGAKTRNICLRRLVASVCTLLLDRGDDCLKEIRHLVCCRLDVILSCLIEGRENEQAV